MAYGGRNHGSMALSALAQMSIMAAAYHNA